MNVMRLVVAGTVGAGKSTFVQTAGEMGVVHTERIATDKTALLKKTTTIAFDFARIELNSDQVVHVYGTPGQYRFNFMWDILLQNAQLCLLLVAAHRPNDFQQARQILSFIEKQYSQKQTRFLPVVVGLTHTDCPGTVPSQEIMTALGYTSTEYHPLSFTIDPRDRTSVLEALDGAANVLIPTTQPGI
jgi:uncharacterized protein